MGTAKLKEDFVILRVGKNQPFSTIQAALEVAPENSLLLISEGIYVENLRIYQSQIALVGQGKVRIRGNFSAQQLDEEGKPRGTFQTATIFLNCQRAHLANLQIENTAGPGHLVGQAVALYSECRQLTVVNCRIIGHQDTLCLGPLPSLDKTGAPLRSPWLQQPFPQQQSIFINCYLVGTIDFIFGGGQAKFLDCRIHSLAERGEATYVTAASTPHGEKGLRFAACHVTGANYYLGRPWRPDGAVSFEDCWFDQGLQGAGWHDWDQPSNRTTARFSEINNHYASPQKRADWITFRGSRKK